MLRNDHGAGTGTPPAPHAEAHVRSSAVLSLVPPVGRPGSSGSEVARKLQLVLDSLPSLARDAEHLRNVAVVHLLFSTGLLPIEVAGLTVGDYLDSTGNVRSISGVRPEVAFNRRSRPLLFVNENLVEAVDAYLDRRVLKVAPRARGLYGGLDPESRLILGDLGKPFRIQHQSGLDGRRSCRGFAKLCARLFAVAKKKYGIHPAAGRRLLARELYREGADPKALQTLFGLSTQKKLVGLIQAELSHDDRLEAAMRGLARMLRTFR